MSVYVFREGIFDSIMNLFVIVGRMCRGRCVRPVFTRTGSSALSPPPPYNGRFGELSVFHAQVPRLNSNRTSVVRCGRQKYERLYPVMLVRPDGSTVNIRYKEPRRILVVSAPAPSLCPHNTQLFNESFVRNNSKIFQSETLS